MKRKAPNQAKHAEAAKVRICHFMAEAIRNANGLPEGTLYLTMLVGFPEMSREFFNSCRDVLTGAGLVSASDNLLSWIGPKIPPVENNSAAP